MKIRTDFVTNSSSSSYCVSFYIKPVGEEKSIGLNLWSDGEDGTGTVWVELKSTVDDVAWSIKDCKTVNEIKELLLNSFNFDEICGEEVEWGNLLNEDFNIDEVDEEDQYYYEIGADIVSKLKNFKGKLEKISSINDIESVSINEYFTGWGEFARDGVDDFLQAVLPSDEDIDVAAALQDKLTDCEIESILDQIENDSICMFNANIDTVIELSSGTITKKYEFEDMT